MGELRALPIASGQLASKLYEQAQRVKTTDPEEAVRLLEQSIFILVKVICARNNMVRALRRLLLDRLGESKPSEPEH